MERKFSPCKYVIDDGTFDFYISSRDKKFQSWVVEYFGHVLSKSILDFVYEPMPSHRSEEFIEDTRFSNPEQAYEFYLKHIKKSA